jgi:copper chaperone CopZ
MTVQAQRQSLRFRTNIQCSSCVAKITPVLDTLPGVMHWRVDLTSAEKWLIVGGQVSADAIISACAAAGFAAQAENATNGLGDSSAAQNKNKRVDFWQDTAAWRRAGSNTLNCLIGCSVGDLGMMFYLQTYYPALSVWEMMLPAMLCGLLTSVLLETFLLHRYQQLAWGVALQTALRMSFLSMVVMEIAENATDIALTGGVCQPASAAFWLALAASLLAGFIVPLPYNYYRLKRYGKSCH